MGTKWFDGSLYAWKSNSNCNDGAQIRETREIVSKRKMNNVIERKWHETKVWFALQRIKKQDRFHGSWNCWQKWKNQLA